MVKENRKGDGGGKRKGCWGKGEKRNMEVEQAVKLGGREIGDRREGIWKIFGIVIYLLY